jgi:hypothetical protein
VIVDTVMTCDCGFEARAGDGMALSHQEALLVFRGEPTRLPTTPRTTRTESNEEER